MERKSNIEKYKVPIEKLRWKCPPEWFNFDCTIDIEPLKEFIGQDRALDALNFGLEVESSGYNLFLTGLTGTGKTSTMKACLERFIAEKQAEGVKYEPSDLCYVYNFSDPDRPKFLKLPQGYGKSFVYHMESLLKTLKEEIPKLFNSEEYKKQKQEVIEQHQREYQSALNTLEKEARSQNLMIQISSMGANVLPMIEGQPMSREAFLELPEHERETIEAKRVEMLMKMDETATRFRDFDKKTEEKMLEINRKAGDYALSGHFKKLFETYREYPDVVSFLEEIKEYSLSKLDLFTQAAQAPQTPELLGIPLPPQVDPFLAYRVNLIVDNSTTNGPPIVVESNPNWFNLFGKIERKAFIGTYVSDHTMVKPGSVQKANGGYLILNIRDVLMNPGVWEGLKRVIRTKEVGVEEPWEQYGFFSPQGMRPQPIPVDIKIVMIGED
ncbi:MAG: ATP-binding protein, partial [Thermodesulfobacteriota bacterium]|nr:ATP-binding protein [Thermodesulfobacteriota bacterium]